MQQSSILHRFSSFKKLLAIVAWIFRFKHNALRKQAQFNQPKYNATLFMQNPKSLTFEEIENAKRCILKLLQTQIFSSEITQLTSNGQVNKTN